MKTLIVTYDLVNPGQNYERLLQRIRAYGTWARLGGSSYLIRTAKTPIQVRDDLVAVLDANDQLFIGTAPPPSAWNGLSDEISKWIHANQIS